MCSALQPLLCWNFPTGSLLAALAHADKAPSKGKDVTGLPTGAGWRVTEEEARSPVWFTWHHRPTQPGLSYPKPSGALGEASSKEILAQAGITGEPGRMPETSHSRPRPSQMERSNRYPLWGYLPGPHGQQSPTARGILEGARDQHQAGRKCSLREGRCAGASADRRVGTPPARAQPWVCCPWGYRHRPGTFSLWPSTRLLSACTQQAGLGTKPMKVQGGAPSTGGPGSGSQVCYLPRSRACPWPGQGSGSPVTCRRYKTRKLRQETGSGRTEDREAPGPVTAGRTHLLPRPGRTHASSGPRDSAMLSRPPASTRHQHDTAWTAGEQAAQPGSGPHPPRAPAHGTLTVLRSMGCLMMSW